MRGTRTKKRKRETHQGEEVEIRFGCLRGAGEEFSRLFSSAFPIFCFLFFSASTSWECEKGRPGTARRGEETKRKMFEKLKSRKIALLRSDLVVLLGNTTWWSFSFSGIATKSRFHHRQKSASSEIIDMKFIWLERRSTFVVVDSSHNNVMAEV